MNHGVLSIGRRVCGPLLAFLVLACGPSPRPPAAGTEFRVLYTSPEEGSIVKDHRPILYVVFSHPVDAASINSDTVILRTRDRDPVQGNVTVARFSPTMVVFEPNSDLGVGMEYVLSVSPDAIRDEMGSAITGDHEFRFGLEGTPPPTAPSAGHPEIDPVDAGDVIYAGGCYTMGACPWFTFAFEPETGDSVPTLYEGSSHGAWSRPSPRLHQGDRVWLRLQEGAATMPNGESNTVLTAEIPSREISIPIVGHASAVRISHPRWAKDETFISYWGWDWSNASSPKNRYVKHLVQWSADGVPSFGPPSIVKSSNAVQWNGGWKHTLAGYDWAPNGVDLIYRELDYTSGSQVQLVKTSVAGVETVLDQSTNIINWPAWSPAGDRVAYRLDNLVIVVRPDGTGRCVVGQDFNIQYPYPAFSPDGRRLAFAAEGKVQGQGASLYVVDSDGGDVVHLNAGGPQTLGLADWVSLADVR